MTPRDFTPQEETVAECLDEIGFRYFQQVEFGKYTVDFLVEDNIILEVDGVFGHYRKADRKRDAELLEFSGIKKVVHVTGYDKDILNRQIIDLVICQE